jgi:tyrosine-protein phosphatase SIW14
MPRPLNCLFGLTIVGLLVGGPWSYAHYLQKNYRNFHTVRPGVLYRSGQLTLPGLKRLVHDYGIRCVISLRDAETPGQNPPDLAEEEFCRKEDIAYHRLPPRVWWANPGAPVPGDENIQHFLAVMDDPANYPVLIHCFAGCHRTGIHCAVFRMEYDRWDNATAIAEMKHYGYVNFDGEEDVRGYLEGYVPRWRRTSQP